MTRLKRPVLPVVGLLLAWIGCYLPWVAATGAALSSNSYDLAEWMSLYPGVRGGNLLIPLLLRAVSGLLAVQLALTSTSIPSRSFPWLIRVLALLIGIGLLPPLDFFRGQFGDPNYRQQFLIALLTCAGVALAIWKRQQIRHGWARLLTVLTAAVAIAGLVTSLTRIASVGLHVSAGIGAPLVVLGIICTFLTT